MNTINHRYQILETTVKCLKRSLQHYFLINIKIVKITQAYFLLDLQQSLKQFSQDEVISYSQMLFDVARNQVLVGAR